MEHLWTTGDRCNGDQDPWARQVWDEPQQERQPYLVIEVCKVGKVRKVVGVALVSPATPEGIRGAGVGLGLGRIVVGVDLRRRGLGGPRLGGGWPGGWLLGLLGRQGGGGALWPWRRAATATTCTERFASKQVISTLQRKTREVINTLEEKN